MQGSGGYSLFFASAVCVVCAVFVSSSAVALKERQDYNANLDKQRNVLVVSGLAEEDERLSSDEVERRFANIRQFVIDLETGQEAPDVSGDATAVVAVQDGTDPASREEDVSGLLDLSQFVQCWQNVNYCLVRAQGVVQVAQSFEGPRFPPPVVWIPQSGEE